MALKPKGTSNASKPRKSAAKAESPPTAGAVLEGAREAKPGKGRKGEKVVLAAREAKTWLREVSRRGRFWSSIRCLAGGMYPLSNTDNAIPCARPSIGRTVGIAWHLGPGGQRSFYEGRTYRPIWEQ